MQEWLNDTTADGFLGNLREPEKFIKMDSKWNATAMTDVSKPPKTTIVESPVGLINLYEYTMSYDKTTYKNGYLNNNLESVLLTPYNDTSLYAENNGGILYHNNSVNTNVIRPSINLQPNIKIVDGCGTEDDPYRLMGDNDENLEGALLNTRFSGEYISFGVGDNNLYRIVSHETEGLTKITSDEPLKENGNIKLIEFGENNIYSSTNTIGSFLNNNYLNPSSGYLNSEQVNMIGDNTIWYLGKMFIGGSYKLAKYTDITGENLTPNTTIAKVGLLRIGELMSGVFSATKIGSSFWSLTSSDNSMFYIGENAGFLSILPTSQLAIKPALNLKSNVVITSGDGTKENPFEIELAS